MKFNFNIYILLFKMTSNLNDLVKKIKIIDYKLKAYDSKLFIYNIYL